MKVLFLANIPSPYRVLFFNELGRFCDLTVVFEGKNATDRNENWKAEEINSFHAIYLNGMRITSDGFLSLKIIPILRKEWDRIIIGGYSTPTGILAIEYLRFIKKDFYISADGGFIKKDRWLIHKLKKHLISSAIGWLSTGNNTSEYLCHYGAKKEKCAVYRFTSVTNADVNDAIEMRQEDKSIRKKRLGICEEKMVLSVGQFVHRKGFDVLLSAAKTIKQEIGLYIVGGTATSEYLKLKESLNLQNIHFVDFMKKEQLKEYYACADVFAFPTREDIWGLVINEAISFGLPVVTTDKCNAGLEIIEDGRDGYIVSSESPDQLSEKINELLGDDEKRKLFSKRIVKKAESYTIEQMVQDHLRILEVL